MVYPLWSIKVAIWVGFCLFATIILPDKNVVFLVQNGTTPPYTAVQPGNNLSDTALYHIEKYIQCKLDKISSQVLPIVQYSANYFEVRTLPHIMVLLQVTHIYETL